LKADELSASSVSTGGKSLEQLLDTEWLLTNGRGGYASSTIIGCNTRRYHGLLVGSLNPPGNRITALATCLEMLILKRPGKDRIINLSTVEFGDNFAPEGFAHINRFRKDVGVHFDYQISADAAESDAGGGSIELTKSVYLLRNSDTVGLVYDFKSVKEPVEFALRPFVGLRDFHSLQKSYAPLQANFVERKPVIKLFGRKSVSGLVIRHDVPDSCELLLSCPNTSFVDDRQWWFNFVYRVDKQRGQDFAEDLWTPGFFKCLIDKPTKIILWANLSYHCQFEKLAGIKLAKVREDLLGHQRQIADAAGAVDSKLKYHFAGADEDGAALEALFLAAEKFVSICEPDPACLAATKPDQADAGAVGQQQYESAEQMRTGRTTILAGFPWFADWGRDAFVALDGLLLATGRFDEAKSVLTTFASAADEGMIPNRFDDYGGTAYFNSVDASLWFIEAAFKYLEATGDDETFSRQLLPTICRIVDCYAKGTRFGIHADADGLITAGDQQTQLTWMDAKFGGVAFTPRYGKSVEVNALWYNALCQLAQFHADTDKDAAEKYGSMAEKVREAFCRLFWNGQCGYLNDCVLPDGTVDSSLRPNQIFAVSLGFSPLSGQQQGCVIDTVQRNLLTPYGLRTLNKDDARYKGIYSGPQQMRDEAYHQGTVWPYLIGPFIEGYLKVHGFTAESKKQAAEFIKPLMHHLCEQACLGQVSEIFDGDPPHKPRGCIAQAWSVAELIRAYLLING